MIRERLAERCYRFLLRLYPRSFRELFADEMVELLRDSLRAARRRSGVRGAVAIWSRAFVDLIISAATVRVEGRPCAQEHEPALPYSSRRQDGMITTIYQDFVDALRTLRRRPGPTLAIIATLALAIGANSSLFSVVDTVLLQPLPFTQPERLVMLWNRYGTQRTALSPPDYVDRRDQSELLVSVAAIRPDVALNLAGTDSRQVRASRVTSAYFDVLGVRPLIGHAAFAHEESGEVVDVAVLSHGLWQRSFGGDPGVIGRDIELHGQKHTVLAVMGPDFNYPRGSEVWLPLTFTPQQLDDTFRGNEYLGMIGRIKDGVTLEQVRAEMDAIAARVIERVPERASYLANNGWGAVTVPLDDELVGRARPALWTLFGAVVLLLLIACVNVANVLLASTAERTRELALRSSLGASRGRLVRQLLTESLVLALAGCSGGLGLAFLSLRYFPAWIPHDIPRLEQVSLDLRVVAFTAVLAIASSLIFGTLPAWQGSAVRLRDFLQASVGRRGGRRLRGALVVVETALALVLLIGAGLLLRSFDALTKVDPGFASDQRLTFRLTLPASAYPEPQDRLAFQQGFLAQLRALPGLRAAAASSRVPLDGQPHTGTFHVVGHVPAPGEKTPGGEQNQVSPDFFRTLGIPLLAGRELIEADATGPGVAIVDAWAADRFWPDGNALGQRIYFSSPERDYEIVGVVGHVKQMSLDEEGRMQVYLPSNKFPLTDLTFTVHSEGSEPERLIGLIRHALGELAPDLPLFAVRTSDRLVAETVALPRFNLLVLGAFSLVAILLAALGLYGVLTRSVSLRTSELGLRMALGASTGAILRQVIREGLMLAGAGLVIGMAGAIAATRLMASLLYGVEPDDPTTFAVISLVLAGVALLATYLPARRAAHLDPVEALRAE